MCVLDTGRLSDGIVREFSHRTIQRKGYPTSSCYMFLWYHIEKDKDLLAPPLPNQQLRMTSSFLLCMKKMICGTDFMECAVITQFLYLLRLTLISAHQNGILGL